MARLIKKSFIGKEESGNLDHSIRDAIAYPRDWMSQSGYL